MPRSPAPRSASTWRSPSSCAARSSPSAGSGAAPWPASPPSPAVRLPLPTTQPDVRADVTLAETAPPPEREVAATVRFDPPSAVADPDWLRLIAYQGREPSIGSELEQIAPGVYRSEPFPVHGTWKSAIRYHRGAEMAALPIYLPRDPEIPAAKVPAPASFSRQMIEEKTLLQRELSTTVPAWATPAAWLFVGLALLTLILGIGWSLMRLAVSATATTDRAPGGAPAAIGSHRRTGRRGPSGRPGRRR